MFDEIDTGIGGRSADPVGRSLWTLARAHQVLCVTHLPQIAAYADAHYRIAKRERDGRTVTEITRLDRGGARGGAGADDRRSGRRRGGAALGAASCSTAPRPGGPAAPSRPAADRRLGSAQTAVTSPSLDQARSRATSRTCGWSAGSRTRPSRAYRADLADFAMSRGAATGLGGRARRSRSGTSRRGPAAAGPASPGLAPTSLRRRAASIRGFYRFAYGDGLIAGTSPRTWTCRASRACSRRR